MVKKAGDWTNKLYELAQNSDYTEANGLGGEVRVPIEGPYSDPGHAISASISSAMVVTSGSGHICAHCGAGSMKKDLEERSRRIQVHALV